MNWTFENAEMTLSRNHQTSPLLHSTRLVLLPRGSCRIHRDGRSIRHRETGQTRPRMQSALAHFAQRPHNRGWRNTRQHTGTVPPTHKRRVQLFWESDYSCSLAVSTLCLTYVTQTGSQRIERRKKCVREITLR